MTGGGRRGLAASPGKVGWPLRDVAFEVPAGHIRLTAARRGLAAERGKLAAVVPILAEREVSLGILLEKQLTARSEHLEVKRRLVEARNAVTVHLMPPAIRSTAHPASGSGDLPVDRRIGMHVKLAQYTGGLCARYGGGA